MTLLELFCEVDDFCKTFELWWKKQLIKHEEKKRNKACSLSLSHNAPTKWEA